MCGIASHSPLCGCTARQVLVELDQPAGEHDGTVDGHTYAKLPQGTGVLVPGKDLATHNKPKPKQLVPLKPDWGPNAEPEGVVGAVPIKGARKRSWFTLTLGQGKQKAA